MVKVFAELNKSRDRIQVNFPYDRDGVRSMRRIPGHRFVGPEKGGPHWLVPLDLTSAQKLREEFGEYLELGTAVRKWGHREMRKFNRLIELSNATDAELKNLPKKLPKLAKALRPYQRADVVKMAASDVINANVPGLGKTIETIAAVYEAEENLDNGQMIVIAPKTSLEVVWLYELDRWLPESVPVFLLSGDDKPEDRKEILDEIREHHDNGEPAWLVTTPNAIRYEEDKAATKKNAEAGITDGKGKVKKVLRPKFDDIFEIEWTIAIWDEYHKMGLSNPQRDSDGTPITMLAKAAFDLMVTGRKWLLSGTPMGGKPIKLWAALSFLDPGRFTSMWRWVDEWLVTEEKEINQEGETRTAYYGVRDELQEKFNDHVMPYMIRRTKKEVAKDLPDKQYVHLEVEMTKGQRKQYMDMAKNAEVKIEEENLSATNILTEYMRLKQFAGAKQKIIRTPKIRENPRTGEKEKYDEIKLEPTTDSGKLPYILDLLNERGIYTTKQIKKEGMDPEDGPGIIIASQFAKIADMIHGWLTENGIVAEKLTGATTQHERTRMVEEFQEGKFRVIVLSTTAGGVAITLDRADTGIILDETWDPDDQSQLEDRFWGRKLGDVKDERNKATVYYIRSKDTIEHYIWLITQGKQITNETILDMRRAGFRAAMDEAEAERVAANAALMLEKGKAKPKSKSKKRVTA